jgi:hypothetical protein
MCSNVSCLRRTVFWEISFLFDLLMFGNSKGLKTIDKYECQKQVSNYQGK